MPGSVSEHARRIALEKEIGKYRKEALINELLASESEDQAVERKRFETELVTADPAISHERAQHLYKVRLAMYKLYMRHGVHYEPLSEGDFQLLLTLGHDLIETEGKKGVIPAMFAIRGGKRSDEPIRYQILTPTPDVLFFEPLYQYFSEGGKDRKHPRQDIFDTLEFSHGVYNWSNAYMGKYPQVGTESTATRGLTGDDYKRAVKREKDERGAQANYLAQWRGVPFGIFSGLLEARVFDLLPLQQRTHELMAMFRMATEEIVASPALQERAYLETVVRDHQAIRVLHDLKAHYIATDKTDFRIRKKLHKEIARFITDHPGVLDSVDTSRLLRGLDID